MGTGREKLDFGSLMTANGIIQHERKDTGRNMSPASLAAFPLKAFFRSYAVQDKRKICLTENRRQSQKLMQILNSLIVAGNKIWNSRTSNEEGPWYTLRLVVLQTKWTNKMK